jgi:rhodanese-related sulfurtransferase
MQNLRSLVQKRIILKVLMILAAAAAISPAAVNSLDQDVLKRYIESGPPFDFILVDVRSADEASTGIGSAACKPYNFAWPDQFKAESQKIPKDSTVILYCRSGSRANNAAAYLDSLGFSKVYNAGGMLTWTGTTVPRSNFKSASDLPEPSMKAKAVK